MNASSNLMLLNRSACVVLDETLAEMIDMRHDASAELLSPTGITVPSVTLFASIVLLAAGARVFRVAAAVSAAAFGFCVVYTFVRLSGQDVSCEASIVGSAIVAMLAGLAAGCILKAGLFFVGAAATMGMVHMTFAAFPTLHAVGNQPTIAEKSFSYWILLLSSGVAGGLAVRYNDRAVLEILTSCIGGAGTGYALRSINEMLGGDAPRWVFVIVAFVSATVGIVVQRRFRADRPTERRRRRREGETGTVLVRGV